MPARLLYCVKEPMRKVEKVCQILITILQYKHEAKLQKLMCSKFRTILAILRNSSLPVWCSQLQGSLLLITKAYVFICLNLLHFLIISPYFQLCELIVCNKPTRKCVTCVFTIFQLLTWLRRFDSKSDKTSTPSHAKMATWLLVTKIFLLAWHWNRAGSMAYDPCQKFIVWI